MDHYAQMNYLRNFTPYPMATLEVGALLPVSRPGRIGSAARGGRAALLPAKHLASTVAMQASSA